jgi:hypothetical protein
MSQADYVILSDLNLPENQSELLAFSLKVWHLVEKDTKISLFPKCQKDFISLFLRKEIYCTLLMWAVMEALGQKPNSNNVSLAVRECMWFMHDCAPAYFSHVLDVLSSTYHNRWIGRERPTLWPSCSPDLNHLDIYLWGHFKALVYSPLVHNVETLHQHIVNTCQVIWNCPGSLSGFESPW